MNASHTSYKAKKKLRGGRRYGSDKIRGPTHPVNLIEEEEKKAT